MSILYRNARSIILKRNHLLTHAIAKKSDFIMIAESWLNIRDKHPLSEAAITGYNILVFEKSRLQKHGGGILIYVKNGIHATKLSKIDVEPYDSLYVEIKKNNKKYILGVVYIPPQTK